ncbi:vWA domain-containing protein, partial [Deinococcus pimensis]|uniref:vWA domain-containing protein n=1 Tax=Deinococcus pimensis TaxID=309888 RepID=UPI0006941DFE
MPQPQRPTVTFQPLRRALVEGADQTLDVLVRVEAPTSTEVAARTARPPLNLSLVIDRSGSMSGDKLRTARKVALTALGLLTDRDRFSVVTFDDHVEVVVPSTPGGERAQSAEALIRDITAGGSTALHEGWRVGGLQVAEHQRPGHLNRVLLISDGEANVGLTDPRVIAGHVAGLAARGVSTTTFGMGDHYDEQLLETVASAGDGNAHYVRDARDLETMFDEELRGLSATLGRAVSLGAEPNAEFGVTVQDVLNDLPRNGTGTLRLPNLVAGRTTEIALRLHLPARALPAHGTVGVTRVRLAWD